MNAGRELDALIAEKVMGIAPRELRLRGSLETVTIHSDSPYYQDGQHSLHDLEWAWPRPYSTHIAAAWEVVEKMGASGLWCRICSPFVGADTLYWAGFSRHGEWTGLPEHDAGADTITLAICLAALKAVGHAADATQGDR